MRGIVATQQVKNLVQILMNKRLESRRVSIYGKYTEHRAAADNSGSIDDVDVKSIEFNPWQYGNLVTE